MSMYVPTVYEKSSMGERYFDLYSRLLKDRIVFIQSFINEFTANVVVGQLLFLEADDPDKDIYLYINTPGGSVTDGLAIYDTIQYVRSDVQTICIGEASSIGALILASGAKGKRFSLPHSRIMIHQPLGGATGQATDIEIQANELMRVRNIINKILIKHTGKPLETIEQDTDRDFFMSAEESKEYGIIDVVIERSDNGDASGS